eukprot:3546579-Amphidinium_carterae.2
MAEKSRKHYVTVTGLITQGWKETTLIIGAITMHVMSPVSELEQGFNKPGVKPLLFHRTLMPFEGRTGHTPHPEHLEFHMLQLLLLTP